MKVACFKKAALNPYVIIALSGILLNISFFIHNIYAQIFALYAIAPVFYVNRYGVVKRMPLPAYSEGVLVIETKI